METVAVVVVGLSIATVAHRERRHSRSGLPVAWAALAWFVPLLSKVITSQMRFGLGAWPAFAVTAEGDQRWARAARWVAAAVGAGLTILLLHRWAHGQYDG